MWRFWQFLPSVDGRYIAQSGRDVPRLCACCLNTVAGNFLFVLQESKERAMK